MPLIESGERARELGRTTLMGLHEFSTDSGHFPHYVSHLTAETEMDRYLRVVFTVIAIALVWIGVKDFSIVGEAMASTGVVDVKIVGMNWNHYRPIPVKVEGEIVCKSMQ